MNKILKTLSYIAGTILLVTACDSSLLDIPQQGVQSEDNSYITDEDCEAAIASVYAKWRSTYSGTGVDVTYCNLFWTKNLLADEMFSEHTNQNEIANSVITPANLWITGCYKMLFQTVYAANLVIDKFSPEESAVKARDIAEARFFRALCYYELITLWGKVPKVDHVLAPDEYQIGNAEYDDLWAFVEKDLTDAINSGALPSKKGIDDKDTGVRITKEAALAVLGKVYLTEEKFSDARDAFGKVISSRLYGLIPDPGDLYHGQSEGCREYLFENNRHWDLNNLTVEAEGRMIQDGWIGFEDNWLFGYGITAAADAPFPFVQTRGWGAMCPAKKVYDAFIAEEGPVSVRRRASVIGYDDLAYFKVNVSGLVRTWPGNEGVLRMKWLMGMNDEPNTLWTGRLTNTPCMRYADVLLMMAEACVRDGQSGDAYVNEVRARAGLSAKSGVTLSDVKKERFLEMCFEGTRFQDLKRWGDLASELADKGKKIPTLMPGWVVAYNDNPDPAAGWQSREEVLPFPQVETETNKVLDQNEGYN